MGKIKITESTIYEIDIKEEINQGDIWALSDDKKTLIITNPATNLFKSYNMDDLKVNQTVTKNEKMQIQLIKERKQKPIETKNNLIMTRVGDYNIITNILFLNIHEAYTKTLISYLDSESEYISRNHKYTLVYNNRLGYESHSLNIQIGDKKYYYSYSDKNDFSQDFFKQYLFKTLDRQVLIIPSINVINDNYNYKKDMISLLKFEGGTEMSQLFEINKVENYKQDIMELIKKFCTDKNAIFQLLDLEKDDRYSVDVYQFIVAIPYCDSKIISVSFKKQNDAMMLIGYLVGKEKREKL